jgi:hypothetical protein
MARDPVRDLKFHNRAAMGSKGHVNDRMHEREHAGNTTAVNPKTLDFSLLWKASTGAVFFLFPESQTNPHNSI